MYIELENTRLIKFDEFKGIKNLMIRLWMLKN